LVAIASEAAFRNTYEGRVIWLRTRPRAWAVPIGLLVFLYAFSFLTLPAVEKAFHERAVKLGWLDK
jgi:hypothetical protein